MTMSARPNLTQVICAEAPSPLGHYAQAVLHGNMLYVSGQLGLTKDTQEPQLVGVGEQVLFALGNIEKIARTVGADRTDLVKATIFVTEISQWGEANRAYASFFGDHKPARSVVPCKDLHLGSKIEIEAVVAIA
jgi:2-iminobutanoate/2-iminopropanoate deaminase